MDDSCNSDCSLTQLESDMQLDRSCMSSSDMSTAEEKDGLVTGGDSSKNGGKLTHLFDEDNDSSANSSMDDNENQEPNSPKESGTEKKTVDDIRALTNSTAYTLGRTDSFRDDMQPPPASVFQGTKVSAMSAALRPMHFDGRSRTDSYKDGMGDVEIINNPSTALGPADFPSVFLGPPSLSRSDSYREEMTQGMDLPVAAPNLGGRGRIESSQDANGQLDSAKKLKPSHNHCGNTTGLAMDELQSYEKESRFDSDFEMMHLIGIGTFGAGT